MIPLPKLLDAGMDESRRIRPIDASVKETIIPLSYATIQLAENENIPAKSYVEMFTPNGSAGIFRTKARPDGYGDSMPVLELEHAVTEIGDFLVREDIEAEMTLSAAFTRLFSHYRGSLWQLGTVSYTDLVVVDLAYEPILQGMLLVLEQIPKYYLTFDFTTTPWTLSVAERGTTVSAEGRLSRNVKSATVTPDDTDFCTRVYMKGLPLKPGQSSDELGYIDADTISTYGVVERRLDGSDSLTQEQAVRKATAYLNKRKRPKLAVSISGADFSSVTGETLDRVAIGKLYRLAVPKHNTTVEENITGIEWRSVYKNPNLVQIDLSEEADPTVDFLQQQRALSRSSRRAATKEMDYFYQELFSDDGIIHSVILQTSTMIRTEVGSAVSGIYGSVIEQTASYIRSVVYDTASSISQSVIEQTSEHIRTVVESTASGVAWSVVEQTMTNIVQRIGRKNQVYVQLTDPNDGINELIDGDIWIFSAKRTWGEMKDLTWGEVAQRKWRDYYGALQYVWKNGAWIKVVDEAAIVESETWVEQDSERYAILARQVDSLGVAYHSNLTVTAQKISSEVSTAKGQLYSAITQTATNIMMQVADKERDLQTSIEQTAERITISASAAQSSLYSFIQVTASDIRLEVANVESGLQSWIEQTPDLIEAQVSNASTDMWGIIQLTATGIKQLVGGSDGKGGWIGSAILQTSTNIHIAVSNSKSDFYSGIEVQKQRINLVVEGSGSGAKIKQASIVAAINEDSSSSVYISADKIKLDGYTIAHYLTADYIKTKLLEATGVTLNGVTVNSSAAFNGSLLFKNGTDAHGNTYFNALDALQAVQITGPTNNSYKLQYKRVRDSSWQDAQSFSRAVTDWSYSWSGGQLTVTALPQNNSKAITGVKTTGSWSNNVYNGKVVYWDGTDDDGTTYNTGATFSVSRAIEDWGYSWDNGQLTVAVSPQNVSKALIGVRATGSWSGYTYSGRVVYWDGTDDERTWPTGATFTISDSDLVSSNIKNGVTIFGVTGSYSGGGGGGSISITPDNVGHSSEPDGTRIWSTTTLLSGKWYKFTVTCGDATKVYKIYIN